MDPNASEGPRYYGPSVKIDYEAVNVADIMKQIQEKAARRPEDSPPASGPSAFPAGPVEPLSLKKRIKAKVQRFMTPFFPVIRLLALPVHEDLMQTIKTLHETNVRLDALHPPVAKTVEYTKILHSLCHNLVVELTKLRVEHEMLKSRVQILEKNFEHLVKRERALEHGLRK